MNIWGSHLSLDCSGNALKCRDKDFIIKFFDKLVEAINMEFWLDERNKLCVHFGKDNKKGYTYSALITTSNVCCHFCDDGNFFLDVFTCKYLDVDLVKKLVETEFEAHIHNEHFRERGTYD